MEVEKQLYLNCYWDLESLVRAKSEIKEKVGKDVAIYTVDATNEDSIIALVNTVVSNHKKADILVNAQGYNKKFSLFDFPMDVMADMMNVNVIGVAMARSSSVTTVRSMPMPSPTSILPSPGTTT